METFITVGTDTISEDLFLSIEDPWNGEIKPTGGLWFTRFLENNPNHNAWLHFLITHPSVLRSKNTSEDFYNQKAAVITLKPDAKIYTLNSTESFDELKQKFPKEDEFFSYEAMAKEFDGILVDAPKFFDREPRFRKFGVESLILFNTEVIQYFRRASVEFDLFDLECFIPLEARYQISVSEQQETVTKTSSEYEQLIHELGTIIRQILQDEYPSYKDMDRQTLVECIYEIARRLTNNEENNVLKHVCRAILKTLKA